MLWCDASHYKTYGNVTKDGQQDVDEEISVAAALEEDTQRRKDDGKKDLADIAGGERHDGCGFGCSTCRAGSRMYGLDA
jgi:hypothetical protein